MFVESILLLQVLLRLLAHHELAAQLVVLAVQLHLLQLTGLGTSRHVGLLVGELSELFLLIELRLEELPVSPLLRLEIGNSKGKIFN